MGNMVHKLEDGRVEILFTRPAKNDNSLKLLLYLGHRKGNEIVERNGEVCGVRCQPKDWTELLEKIAPDIVKEFKEIIK